MEIAPELEDRLHAVTEALRPLPAAAASEIHQTCNPGDLQPGSFDGSCGGPERLSGDERVIDDYHRQVPVVSVRRPDASLRGPLPAHG